MTKHRTHHSNDSCLEILAQLGGYYSCPKTQDGLRKGPLVGYAGTYIDPDGNKKNWVGDVYANFAKAEERPEVLHHFAEQLLAKLPQSCLTGKTILCAAPYGGYCFAQMLGLVSWQRVIKAEKKVTRAATMACREESELVFSRHSIESGQNYIIVEDVCNNFSTTDQLIKKIYDLHARVVFIVCLLNRSKMVEDVYLPASVEGCEIPVVSLVRQCIHEYRQDDPFVVQDIAQNNVIWNPKANWSQLAAAMKK